MVNNFGTTEHIELILVPIDQKLIELTDRIRNFSEKQARKFFEIVFSKSHKSGGVHPSRFINFSEKPLDPYQKLIEIELSNLGQFWTKKGGLKAQDNHNRVEIRQVIRPFTVSVNCQISALTSIRRGLGKDPIPFPVNSSSIKVTQNVSGGV